jgi:hypothetical protein
MLNMSFNGHMTVFYAKLEEIIPLNSEKIILIKENFILLGYLFINLFESERVLGWERGHLPYCFNIPTLCNPTPIHILSIKTHKF